MLKWNGAKILAKIENEVKEEVKAQAEFLLTEADSLIRESKSGRVYMHPQPAPHQSSAPGEPWANWTGATRATFKTEVRDNGLTGVFSTGGASVFWEAEFGTETKNARPLHRPTLANRRDPIIKGLALALRRGTS